jgi:hypothetical protein
MAATMVVTPANAAGADRGCARRGALAPLPVPDVGLVSGVECIGARTCARRLRVHRRTCSGGTALTPASHFHIYSVVHTDLKNCIFLFTIKTFSRNPSASRVAPRAGDRDAKP